jgi:diguanylate cyclase (GGDEF)-like protein
LVIDDSAPVCLWLQKTLGQRFDVVLAHSLRAALEHLELQSLQLILIDAALPDGSGLDFCRFVRQQPELDSVPILMITATSDESLIADAFEAGCSDFVRKPIRPAELFARIDLAMKLKAAQGRIAELIEELRARSERDALTGLYNRHALYERAMQLFQTPCLDIGIVLADVDDFKHCNDALGHLAGDEILAGIAQSLEQSLPPEAIVARYGGDEFLALLPRHDLIATSIVAERCHAEVTATPSPLPVTLSMGYNAINTGQEKHEAKDSLAQIIAQCDSALYSAKRKGKNQLRCGTIERNAPHLAQETTL